MNGMERLMDRIRPEFGRGGKYRWLRSAYEALDSFLSVPETRTSNGAHIRDCADIKRLMLTVIVALLPCFVIACINSGFLTLLPIYLVTCLTGLVIELASAQIRGREYSEGCLVTCMLIPMIVPVTTPLWLLALAVAFALILGKEAFGGTGMNIWNPALLAFAFLLLVNPAQMSGDAAAGIPCLAEGAFQIAVLAGALILLLSGVAPFKLMFFCAAGALAAGLAATFAAPTADSLQAVPAYSYLLTGGFAFGAVFMATDPVTGAQTSAGKWLYGFLTGALAVTIDILAPDCPAGMMVSILIMNTFAPLIDDCVVAANIRRRLGRNKTV